MTAETKIKTISVADDTALRTLEISIGNSKIITPSKSIASDLITVKDPFQVSGNQLCEIYKQFTPSKINKIRNDDKSNQSTNNDIKKDRNKLQNNPSSVFIDYKVKDGEHLLPNETEINTLTNFAYTYSDITPIPAVPKFASKINTDNIDDFIQYITTSIETIEYWNHKPIMGYIPHVAPVYLELILDKYYEHGINAYYLDYNTKGLSNLTNITTIKRHLAQNGLDENHFIHIMNMDYGKINKEINVLPARDFLGFGHGLDSLGNTHRGKGRKNGDGNKPQPPISHKYRVFDSNKYGYYRIDTTDLDKQNIYYPDSAAYSRSEILQEKGYAGKKRMINLVNFEEQRIECLNLRLIATEEEKHSYDYFSKKSCLDKKDLRKLQARHL